MKTFLKIVLIVALALIALKLSPILLVAAFVGLVAAVALGAVGFSLVLMLLVLAVAAALALSPIWIPVLIVLGAINLFKRLGDKPANPPVAA